MRSKQVFTTSVLCVGLILGSVSVASATDSSPTPTPVATASPVATTYAGQLAAYKVAFAAYQSAMDQYRADWKAAVEKYNAAWKVQMDQYTAAVKLANSQYESDQAARRAKRQSIISTFQIAIAKADSDLASVLSGTTTAVQKSVAVSAKNAAIIAAAAARKTALDALGNVVKPALPAKPIKPAALVAPTEPVKPIAPVKPVAVDKANKQIEPSPKTEKSQNARIKNKKS